MVASSKQPCLSRCFFKSVLYKMLTDFWYFRYRIFGIFRYFSLRIISFRIQKILFRFKAKQAKLTFFFAISLRSFSLSFRFQAKWGDTLLLALSATTVYYRIITCLCLLWAPALACYQPGASSWPCPPPPCFSSPALGSPQPRICL